ncbi:AAA+ ATPase domain-containing protein [Plasmodiophora brassicae]
MPLSFPADSGGGGDGGDGGSGRVTRRSLQRSTRYSSGGKPRVSYEEPPDEWSSGDDDGQTTPEPKRRRVASSSSKSDNKENSIVRTRMSRYKVDGFVNGNRRSVKIVANRRHRDDDDDEERQSRYPFRRRHMGDDGDVRQEQSSADERQAEGNDADDSDDVPVRRSTRRRFSVDRFENGTPISSLRSLRLSARRQQDSQVFDGYGESNGSKRAAMAAARSERARRRSALLSGENDEDKSDDDDEEEDEENGLILRRSSRNRQKVQRFHPAQQASSLHNEHSRPTVRTRSSRALYAHEVVRSRRYYDAGPASDRRPGRARTVPRAAAYGQDGDDNEFDDSDFGESMTTGIHPTAMFDIEDKRKASSTFLADVDPMQVDSGVNFESIGGLDVHIDSLKEMVVLPLLYPDLFKRFKVQPPRGHRVLFFGPPGTGKTLTARALANACTANGQKVTFFMRKGADCLSKWVGEAERQLRLLFKEAYDKRPSIIFFDEIDGLAPVRSSRQDQIHSSIVSTLLALMDGLDDRGQVIVIGATNRIDAIDPALRRPGRFDRELNFSLPSHDARRKILEIHTRQWDPPLDAAFVDRIASRTAGFCGADLKALCTEACLVAIRRRYPQIYASTAKLAVDASSIVVDDQDFSAALMGMTPASHRTVASNARPLPAEVIPLLQPQLDSILTRQRCIFPLSAITNSMRAQKRGLPRTDGLIPLRPRILLHAPPGYGQSHLAAAVLHALEEFPVYSLGLPALVADPQTQTPEESCVHAVTEARRCAPSILYWPRADTWWETGSSSLQTTLLMLLDDIPSSCPVLVLATADAPWPDLPDQVQGIFNRALATSIDLSLPTGPQRREYFSVLGDKICIRSPEPDQPPLERLEPLPVVEPAKSSPGVEPSTSTDNEQEKCLRALRLFLRALTTRLMSEFRVFAFFSESSVLHGVQSRSLDGIRMAINDGDVLSIDEYLAEVDRLVVAVRAFQSQPDGGIRPPEAHSLVNKACQLQDYALARVASFNPETAAKCRSIAMERRRAQDAARQAQRRARSTERRLGDDNDDHISPEREAVPERVRDDEDHASVDEDAVYGDQEPDARPDAVAVDEPEALVDAVNEDEQGIMEVDAATAARARAEREWVVDHVRVQALIDRLVEVTDGQSVDELEMTLFRVSAIVQRYRGEPRRDVVVDDVERALVHLFNTSTH